MKRIMEIKTSHTRYVGELEKATRTSQQVSKYLAETSAVLGELVTDAQYRICRKCGFKREGIDPDDWVKRCRKDMQKRPEFYFVTVDTQRNQEQQDRWRREAWEAQRRFLRLEQGGFPLRNTKHCTAYGGCAFVGVCAGEFGIEGFATRDDANPELSAASGDVDPLTYTMISSLLDCEEYARLVYLEGLAKPSSPAQHVGSAVHFGFEQMDPDAAVEHLNESRGDELSAEVQEITAMDSGMVRAIVEFGIPFWPDWPKFREVEYRLPLVNPETGATSLRFHLSGVIDGVWTDSLPPIQSSADPRSHTDRGVYSVTIDPTKGKEQ